jgi:integrase
MNNKNKNKIEKIKNNQLITESEIESKLDLLVKGQIDNSEELRNIRNDLQKGFVGLALRNQELVDLNQKLTQQLETVVTELDQINQEREAKLARQKARANRKRLAKRDPMTADIYNQLIKSAEGPAYRDVRTRLAICLLAVTGIRINELLPLKVGQLRTLLEENWIAIDRSKRGPANHKAFLNKKGRKIIQDRKKDFDFIFLMKTEDSYVFTTDSDHFTPLHRVTITKQINTILRDTSAQLEGEPNITSHSFRIGYITQLWRDSKDIEFVKQTIGHSALTTTSAYITKLSDQERREKIEELN